jgi:DNA-binding NtrC family response regulator
MSVNVIFVDDDERCIDSMRRGLVRMDTCKGWSMIFCTSPEEALTAAKEHGVSALVTDEHMPSMTGHDLINKIRAIAPDVVAILFAGDTDHTHATDTILVEKPCDLGLLAATIAKSIQK